MNVTVTRLPRHLVLAAVVLTVCCAEGRSALPDGRLELPRPAAMQTVESRRQVRPTFPAPSAPAARTRGTPARLAAPVTPRLCRTTLGPCEMRLPPPAS